MPIRARNEAQSARPAAVVVPLVGGERPSVLFVRRAAHLRRNAGQIAFPGGLADAEDGGDLRRTALRELEEELGIAAADVELVHRLSEAFVVNRSVRVTPFVGVLAPNPAVVVDGNEIDRAFEIPLERIVAPGAVHQGVETFAGLRIPTWQFDDGPVHVWGATARILAQLLQTVAENHALRDALAERGFFFP